MRQAKHVPLSIRNKEAENRKLEYKVPKGYEKPQTVEELRAEFEHLVGELTDFFNRMEELHNKWEKENIDILCENKKLRKKLEGGPL